MVTKISELQPINCRAGVEPDTDKTSFATEHYTLSDKIRFNTGKPQKIGGWMEIDLPEIKGASRSVYSATINGKVYTLIGTNEKLYSLIGSTLTNITPLETISIAAANSLSTHYGTLANNPITTISGSNVITVADADASRYQINDTYTLSGATTTNGILNTTLNANHIIRSVGVGTVSFRVATNASGSGSGGGNAVVRTDGLIRVTKVSHGQLDGDRVKISGAATTAGILDSEINLEFIIRNVATNTFDVMTGGTATSSVSASGGAGTVYYPEIADGQVNETSGQGYGMGLYGAGLYGVSKTSSSGKVYPRIWFFDRFGNTIVMTPGNQGKLYQWDGDVAAAPEVVAGAPDAINYMFVSNNIVVTLGYQAGNQIFACDQNNITQWTASSTNQVFQDDIEGAGRFLTHVSVNQTNLLFTENQTYEFKYIGLPNIWSINLKEPAIGVISPMSRVSVEGVAYWMDDKNWFQWEGGNIEVIPSNSQYQSTIHDYVYSNLNFGQKSKIFAWYNQEFSEICWHYGAAGSNEPDRVARFNIKEKTWVPDTFDRTAAEYPIVSLVNPKLMSYDGSASILYKHEIGTDANGEPMEWLLKTNYRTLGKDTTVIVGIIPDSLQVGDIDLLIHSQLYPQSIATMKEDIVTVSPDTGYVPYTVNGRFWYYEFSGAELGQTWQMGDWQEYVQKGASF